MFYCRTGPLTRPDKSGQDGTGVLCYGYENFAERTFSVSLRAIPVFLLRIAAFCQPCHNMAHGMKEPAK